MKAEETMNTEHQSKAPLVAFVTPVYNGAAFLAKAMASVQRQDYKNIIHIVVDNASTDATPDIIKEYEDATIPVRVVRNPSLLSQNDNFNYAVMLVPKEAKYFRILCADDQVAPAYTRRVVDVAERNPTVGMVGCLIHQEGREDEDERTEDHGWPRDREFFSGHEALRLTLLNKVGIKAPFVFFRRDILDTRVPFYLDDLYCSDTEACFDILTRRDWGYVHEDLSAEGVHPDTVTNREVRTTLIDFLEWLRLLEIYAPIAFGPQEANQLILRFKRYYRRRLLVWRFHGRRMIYARHMEWLSTLDKRPHLLQFADAVSDWALGKIGKRELWSGYPWG